MAQQTPQKHFYINVDRCAGCYACELACNEENGFRGIRVFPVGPKRVMFLPVLTNECTSCEHRVKNGLQPACVSTCFTKAIYYGEKQGAVDAAGKKPVIYGTRPTPV